jgi:hypothetical protein
MMIAGRIPGSITSAQKVADQRGLRCFARPVPCPSLRNRALFQDSRRSGFAQQRRTAHITQNTSCSAAVLTAPGDEAGKCRKKIFERIPGPVLLLHRILVVQTPYYDPLFAISARLHLGGILGDLVLDLCCTKVWWKVGVVKYEIVAQGGRSGRCWRESRSVILKVPLCRSKHRKPALSEGWQPGRKHQGVSLLSCDVHIGCTSLSDNVLDGPICRHL